MSFESSDPCTLLRRPPVLLCIVLSCGHKAAASSLFRCILKGPPTLSIHAQHTCSAFRCQTPCAITHAPYGYQRLQSFLPPSFLQLLVHVCSLIYIGSKIAQFGHRYLSFRRQQWPGPGSPSGLTRGAGPQALEPSSVSFQLQVLGSRWEVEEP